MLNVPKVNEFIWAVAPTAFQTLPIETQKALYDHGQVLEARLKINTGAHHAHNNSEEALGEDVDIYSTVSKRIPLHTVNAVTAQTILAARSVQKGLMLEVVVQKPSIPGVPRKWYHAGGHIYTEAKTL